MTKDQLDDLLARLRDARSLLCDQADKHKDSGFTDASDAVVDAIFTIIENFDLITSRD